MSEPLIPRREPQLINYAQFQEYLPNEGKWEAFDGFLFSPSDDDSERTKALLLMLYQVGFKKMLEILPSESRYELVETISNFFGDIKKDEYIEYLERKCKEDYQRGFKDGANFCKQNGHR